MKIIKYYILKILYNRLLYHRDITKYDNKLLCHKILIVNIVEIFHNILGVCT